ncbi:MAG: hypothetical protein L6R40_004601 [Gallowayella cf. fulva]|nr:MAG: hypothetical protein L6R40_004601 [Xanthomendoza cf. fulva]
MDQIDLEAATEKAAIGKAMESEADSDLPQDLRTTSSRLHGSDENIDVRLQNIASAIIGEALRALPGLLQQHIGHLDSFIELPTVAPTEDDTVTGAQESKRASHWEPRKEARGWGHGGDAGHGRIDIDPLVSSSQVGAEGGVSSKTTKLDREVPKYNRKVKVMSNDEIEAENKHRRNIRQKRVSAQDWEHLQDPWKHLRNKDKRLIFDESTDGKRKMLQLELIDAIFSGDTTPREHRRLHQFSEAGLPAISCWISLVGLRVIKLREDCEAIFMHIQMLIECIWACNSSRSASICDVLTSCYRRRILAQPRFEVVSGSRDPKLDLRKDIRHVRVCIYLLNILYKHKFPPLDCSEDLDEAWAMPIPQAEKMMRRIGQTWEPDHGKDYFFTVSDFSLEHLQRIGQLQIHWTEYWDEHLELERRGHDTYLKLYWFSPILSDYFKVTSVVPMPLLLLDQGLTAVTQDSGLSGGLEEDDPLDRAEEVARTLDLVLNPSGKRKRSRQQYGKVKAPDWLNLLAHKKVENRGTAPGSDGEVQDAPTMSLYWQNDDSWRFWRELKPIKSDFCCEIEGHMVSPDPTGPDIERITHLEFPHYWHRLRELRNYMDSRQPTGFLALWRDRRNTNAYFTFWLVVIFGGLGVVLGFGTLAVAILQAWGQLQSLHLSQS